MFKKAIEQEGGGRGHIIISLNFVIWFYKLNLIFLVQQEDTFPLTGGRVRALYSISSLQKCHHQASQEGFLPGGEIQLT